MASGDSRSFDDPGKFVEIPLVNRIRERVKAWREAGYPGVTSVTKRLLEYWRDPEEFENRRFFFCQLEAAETLIWLTEAPDSDRAVAPGLTVRNRLAVLEPSHPENYYKEFHVVPSHMRDRLRQGKVIVRNWHALNWETDEQIARKRSVDKRGARSDEAYVRGVLGEMSRARNILVINDEAHHAWRVPAD